MKRRNFLKNTVSTTILATGGVVAFQYYQQSQLQMPEEDGFNYLFLTEQDRVLLEIIIPVFVSGLDLNKLAPVTKIMQDMESAILNVSLKSQQELRQLFNLLGSGFGRLIVANVWLNWQSASSKSIEKFITQWRDSQVALLQIAYRGLHKLIIGTVYAQTSTWQSIGYPGPPQIGAIILSEEMAISEE